ncbi:MAG TPA: SCO6880 family protein [Streptosporangiaceae bacterium]|nr:SCO6880 family protein [Streptosporangiaceae bacterium]
MTTDHPVRTYGGWRRSRSIGLLGLGPAATFILLGCFAALIVIAAVSIQLLIYVAPPAILAGAAGVTRVGGVPLAQLAALRLRWWHGTHAGYTAYRAEVVQQHTGTLQLPGTLAATELLSAEDGQGGHYGLVRDRHTGYLTATICVAPVSTWLADPADADQWVANWGAWLASLGYLPALRWVTVTVDTAPDPGSTLARQVAAAIDPAAPRPALEIMDQLVASAPAAAADVATRVSITVDPAASPAQPRTLTEAVTETGQALLGLESALGGCGVSVLGRARAADLAGIVRTAFDPAVRGEISRLLAAPMSPALGAHLDWSAAGPAGAEEHWDCYQHDSGTSVTWTWREPPRQNVTSSVLARLLGPGGYPKRVSLQYRPLPAAAAARTLEGEVRAAAFRSEYARRTRRDVTARDAHDQARARQAADEEARGAGVSLIGLYVTVTVTDPAQLPRAAADTEAAAESAKIRLQRLYRSQAAGFTATLPCGICLPELARRLRH